VWRLTETEQELLSAYPDAARLLQEVDGRFTAPVRRLEYIAVRVLFYALLRRVLPIAYRSTGAPYAADNSLYISISHTVRRRVRFVAVMYHPAHAVGIDIEAVAPNVERIRSHFLHPTEQADTLLQLLLCWSGKEAVYKLMDTPRAVDFVKSLHTLPFASPSSAASEGSFIIREQVTPEKRSFRIGYRTEETHVLTWVEGE
jgi:4'-phosphopantetheinyl transferase EntD